LVPAETWFKTHRKKFKNAEDLYQGYLDVISAAVISDDMKKLGYGELRAHDLLEIAREIREDLSELQRGNFNQKLGVKVRLFGSALKGLAKSGSDLDIAYDHGMMTRLMRKTLVDGERWSNAEGTFQTRGIQKIVDSVMRSHVGFEFQADHISSDIDDFDSLTALEPVVLEIDADQVLLKIYSHKTERLSEPERAWTGRGNRYAMTRVEYQAPLAIEIKVK
jgi:hypothetical protein